MIGAILEQTALFFPLALAVYISYKVLDITDLTADASFLIGAAVYATAIHHSIHPIAATLLSMMSGCLLGLMTTLLQVRFRLSPLIAGILLVFMAQSVVLALMGKPNLSLVNKPSLFSSFPEELEKTILLLALCTALACLTAFLLHSKVGLMFYAVGHHSTLLHLLGQRAIVYRALGLCMSNMLASFGGAITAQSSGYADVNMGLGMMLIALTTVILGQSIYTKTAPFIATKIYSLGALFIGVFIYFSILHFVVQIGISPIYLKIVMGLFLIVCLTTSKTSLPVGGTA